MTVKKRVATAILFLALIAGLVMTGWTSVALAEEPVTISTKVEVGFDGKARTGFWIPVTVDLENQGPDFEGEVQVSLPSAGVPQPGQTYQGRYVAEAILPHGSHKRVTVYVPYLSAIPRLEVDLVSRGKTVDSIEPTVGIIGERDLLVGIVGQRASAWNLLTTLELPVQGNRAEVAYLTAAGFPDRPEVLEAFDAIVLGDVRVESLSPASLEALEGWVAGGGTLVASGGANGKSNLKGLPGALLPVAPGDAVKLGSVSALERMGSENLSASLLPVITQSHDVSGRVLAQEGDMPLAVLGQFGNGRVLFLAFDPVAQPLAGWGGMPRVWKELLYQSLPPSILSGSQARQAGPFTPSTQWLYNLSSAVSNLPALEFPSANLLVGLIVGYILLVGPVSYLVLRRLRRPSLAWATIPVLVLLFSSGAYFLAFQSKGNDIQVSAATIVEKTSGTDWARVRQVVGVFAPSEASYRVNLPGKVLAGSWNSGIVFPSAGTGDQVGTVIRHQENGSEADLLKMGMWTMRNLWTEGMQRVEDGLSQNLYLEGDHLKGTVTNSGARALKETWLVAGNAMQNLGALKPGDTAAVDVQLVNTSPGSFYLNQQALYAGNPPPPGGSPEWRLQQQRLQVLSAAIESRYTDLPSGVCALLVGWADERPVEVVINGTKPRESSLTVFIEPVTAVARGAFSLPGGLLTGQIIDVGTTVTGKAPGLLALNGGDATYQFELPARVGKLDRVAIQVPGISSKTQGIKLLAYNWRDLTWQPLDLKTVSLQLPSNPSSVIIPGYAPVPVPPPGVSTGPGGVTVIMPQYRSGIMFSEALEGELPQEALSDYISASGLIRAKLVVDDGITVQLGTPSLAVQGVANE